MKLRICRRPVLNEKPSPNRVWHDEREFLSLYFYKSLFYEVGITLLELQTCIEPLTFYCWAGRRCFCCLLRTSIILDIFVFKE